jgi:hypothetical protein
MASLERLERTFSLYRSLLYLFLFCFAWTQSGCEDDLAELPISKTLSVEWGDRNSSVSESLLQIPLKKVKVTKKKKKYEFSLTTKNGDFSGWVIAAQLSAKLKVKKGQVVGFKKKGTKCHFRHLPDGMPAMVKFKLIRKESKITGKVGESLAFKLLCRKPKDRGADGKVYADGIPKEVWLTGSVKPKWL